MPIWPRSPRWPHHGAVQIAEGAGHEVYADAPEVSLAAVRQVLGTVVAKR